MLFSFFGDALRARTHSNAKRLNMGSHFASKVDLSSLEVATSKNIRRRRNCRIIRQKKSTKVLFSFFGDALRARTHSNAKRLNMGSHFASKANPSSLEVATSKNIRRRRNCRIRRQKEEHKSRSAKLAGKSQNIYLTHGRGELRSPAGDRRSPLRIIKS